MKEKEGADLKIGASIFHIDNDYQFIELIDNNYVVESLLLLIEQ